MNGEIDYQISLADGKYTYIRYKNGGQECLRHGEPWRNLTGDGMILAMGFALEEATKAKQ